MSKFLSTKYSAGAFNFAVLVLRLGLGILMLHHGLDKLMHFAYYKSHFINFLGLGQMISLSLDIFAEFFCSMFVILGLFTRLAVIPIGIAMCVALFRVHGGDVFGAGERATIYLACCIALLFVGAGRVSVDGVIGK